jgi:carboxypeptidase PM20D1
MVVSEIEFREHLAAAIRIATVARDEPGEIDSSAFDDFRSFLESTYPATWSRLSVERFDPHSLLLTWPGSTVTDPPLLLAAHQDVVPVEDPAAWTQPPFGGVESGDHLHGRGAIDDKGSLIAIMEAVEDLVAEGFAPRRTLLLAFGHDEESGGSGGAAAMAAALAAQGVRPALVLDEGGFVTEGVVPGARLPVALIGTSEKGYMDIELTARSDAGHSSTPPRRTAIGRLARAISALERNRIRPRVDVQSPFFEAVAPAARRPLRRVMRSLTQLGPLAERILARRPTTDALIRTTIAPTVFQAGMKTNVLPASARAVLNVRILPGDTMEDVLTHVRRITGPHVEIAVLGGWDPPATSDPDSPGFRAVADTVAEVFPNSVSAPWVVVGATDARFYSPICDTVLRFVPFRMNEAELTGFHGRDERVRIADAALAVDFYRRLIRRFCS